MERGSSQEIQVKGGEASCRERPECFAEETLAFYPFRWIALPLIGSQRGFGRVLFAKHLVLRKDLE